LIIFFNTYTLSFDFILAFGIERDFKIANCIAHLSIRKYIEVVILNNKRDGHSI